MIERSNHTIGVLLLTFGSPATLEAARRAVAGYEQVEQALAARTA